MNRQDSGPKPIKGIRVEHSLASSSTSLNLSRFSRNQDASPISLRRCHPGSSSLHSCSSQRHCQSTPCGLLLLPSLQRRDWQCRTLILNLANSDNADIEGWGDSDVYSYNYSPATGPVMRWGYVGHQTDSQSNGPDICRSQSSPTINSQRLPYNASPPASTPIPTQR